MKKIDENYFKNSHAGEAVSMETMLGEDEQILWRGKPKKSAYLWNAFLKHFPIAFIWLLFDGGIIAMMIVTGAMKEAGAPIAIFLTVFFAFHLLPVWIWLGNTLTAKKQCENLEYAFTNKRIIVRSGVVGVDYKNLYYAQIESVNLKVGLLDRLLKVGDIYIKCEGSASVLFDLEDPYFLTKKLQEIVLDIKTDVEFPNALRPENNPGYQTKYKG